MDDTGSGEFKAPLSVLAEAEVLINGQRSVDYGDPKVMHERIAKIWSAQLDKLLTEPLTGEWVAAMMVGLKLARLAHSPKHRDTWVDIAGYAAIAEKVLEK